MVFFGQNISDALDRKFISKTMKLTTFYLLVITILKIALLRKKMFKKPTQGFAHFNTQSNLLPNAVETLA